MMAATITKDTDPIARVHVLTVVIAAASADGGDCGAPL
jgi:hypothetical protein